MPESMSTAYDPPGRVHRTRSSGHTYDAGNGASAGFGSERARSLTVLDKSWDSVVVAPDGRPPHPVRCQERAGRRRQRSRVPRSP
jgi:hypothetical protein